jgi:hypothetical protein
MAGRYTEYRPEFCDRLIDHMGEGLSYESFAGTLGVCKKTLYNWEKEFPEFEQAKGIGLEKGRLYWEKAGRDGMYSRTVTDHETNTTTRYEPINASVWNINMKNRFGWREKQQGEEDRTVTHKGQVKVERIDLTDRISQIKEEK